MQPAPTPADLDANALARLVAAFYAKVRQDALLGPVFNAAITDWPAHEAKLARFWSSVMLGSGAYHGSPMAAHMRHQSAITPAMFAHWLALWGQTARQLLPAPAAQAVIAKAERIGESLQLALFFRLPPRAA